MYNFQPSLDQHETSGIFSAAKPFDMYTLPVKTNIHLMPALPTAHFCRQKWNQIEVKFFKWEKLYDVLSVIETTSLVSFSTGLKKRKKNPTVSNDPQNWVTCLNTAARCIQLEGNLHKHMYFKARRRQSTFKQKNVHNLNKAELALCL